MLTGATLPLADDMAVAQSHAAAHFANANTSRSDYYSASQASGECCSHHFSFLIHQFITSYHQRYQFITSYHQRFLLAEAFAR